MSGKSYLLAVGHRFDLHMQILTVFTARDMILLESSATKRGSHHSRPEAKSKAECALRGNFLTSRTTSRRPSTVVK